MVIDGGGHYLWLEDHHLWLGSDNSWRSLFRGAVIIYGRGWGANRKWKIRHTESFRGKRCFNIKI